MVVFLFTDIEGSTRLWEEHTAEMGEVIARHDAILRERIEASGGRITKHTGDGVTAAFEDGEPIACALETQQRFAAEAWGAIGELRIRAGLHAGEAQFQTSAGTPAGDYFGPPVNATARVMAAAWGGQILLTPEVTRVSSLPRGATLRDLGEHLLKNVSAPQQLYQLEHPQLPWREFPPPRTLSGQSIRQAVDERGSQLAGLDPRGMAVGLLTAILVPALQGDLDPESGALEGNLGVLDDLGAGTLRAFTAQFAGRLRARRRTGEAPGVAEIQALLDRELLEQWQAGGETAAALRADASRLLQAVQGVEATMSAATQEVREALASGLAELADSFGEFRWMLVGVQDTLAEVRARQALQLALQREQLDLQRQQLVKTNLLLHRQRGAPALAELAVEGEVEEPPPADVPCPYKGLAAFEPEDAAYFFGREELVAELTARLAGTRFLAVVGASGSGKSSLVRAGLLPAAWGGALPGSEAWPTLVLTPGAHPLNELAVRLSVLCDDRPASMLRDLEADHRAAELAIRRGLADQPGDVKLLLVVDQFEEIFALCRDEEERRQFIDALLYAVEAEEGRTIVVPTVRADFYGRCADYPALAARMSDGLLVGPMSEGELRAAIERPAAVVGLRLEPGLTEMILDDVAGEPGALPLLSHALLETFARRRGAELTLSGYAASGGVAGAIAQTADTVYGGLDPEQQALARNVFLRLTELGEEGAQDTRRRVAPGELVRTDEEAPAVEAVLKTLADARLITTGEDTVEVAHEALIREWPTLRRWLDKDREGLRIHRHLTEAGQEWSRLERESGELYRGARLAAAGEWAETHGEALNPLEREFLAASRALAEQEEAEREAQRQRELEAAQKAAEAERKRAEEQTRATGRFRRLAAALGVVFVLAVAAALFAGAQQQRAQEQANARATEVVVRTTAEADSLAAGATAQTESIRAAREARLARARELSAAAISNLDVDPERSILLALQAVAATYAEDGIVTREAEDALHRAVLASRVQLTLSGHNDWVRFVAFSPDGTRLATACSDATATLWDAASGEALFMLSGHEDELSRVVFNPDGTRLATASWDNTAKVWDLEASAAASSGQELMTLTGHSAPVAGVAYSPDGTRLATASGDAMTKLWDAASGQELLSLTGHTGLISAVTFSPDGTRLATASWDGTARVYVLPIEDLIALAQSRVTRSLTTEECQQYLHVDACPERP